MKDYVLAREAKDYPNAIGIWDAMAHRIYKHIELSAPPLRKELPPIFSSFMPKSGGTFLFNRMIKDVGYKNYHWAITKIDSDAEVYPTPNAVRAYQQGGVFAHSHVIPSPYFCMVDSVVNLGEIWVHVRNPLDAALAAYHHYQGRGQGDGPIADRRNAKTELHKQYLSKKHGINFDDRNSTVLAAVHFYSNWLKSWLDFHRKNPGRVFFTFFDELSDPARLLEKVLIHHGFTGFFELSGEIDSDDRRRLDGDRNWSFGLSQDTIDKALSFSKIWDDFLDIKLCSI